MLSIHQLRVVEFFNAKSSTFLQQLSVATPNKFTVLEKIFPLMMLFLDEELRKEIKFYQYQSQGYNRVLDMIIEVNVTTNYSALHDQLMWELAKIFDIKPPPPY